MIEVSGPGEPYGGRLVDRVVSPSEADAKLKEAGELSKVAPFIDFVYDTEKIAVGAYSPLEGFMDSKTFNSVVSSSNLPNGLPWTIPIVMAVPKEKAKELREGETVALTDWSGNVFATLEVSEIYPLPKEEFAKGAYGTADLAHPNVDDIFHNYGDMAVAGKVKLLRKLDLPTVSTEMTPKEMRELFKSKGWKHVVAY